MATLEIWSGIIRASNNRIITRYGKRHLELARNNIEFRDNPTWDKYYNVDFGRFTSKTGKITVSKERIPASIPYSKQFQDGNLKVPDGKMFDFGLGRLVKTRKLRAGETLKDGVIYKKPEIFIKSGKKYHVNVITSVKAIWLLRNGKTYEYQIEKSYPDAFGDKRPDGFLPDGTFIADRDFTHEEFKLHMQHQIEIYTSDHYTGFAVRITKITATPVSGTALGDIRMGNIRMLYSKASRICDNVETRKGSCVADYILYECSKQDSKMNHILRPQVSHLKTANQVVEWAKNHKGVSVYCITPLGNVFISHVADKTRVCLMFIVNNGHCFPVKNDTQRQQIAQCGKMKMHSLETKVDFANAVYLEDFNTVAELEQNKDIVINTANLEVVALKVMECYNVMVDGLVYRDSQLQSFVHPITNKTIVSSPEWEVKRAVCDKYFNEHRVIDYKWANQGWGEMGRTIMENQYSKIPKSHYSPDMLHIIENYPIRPYQMYKRERLDEKLTSADIHRSYTSVLMNNTIPFAIDSAFDEITPFTFTSIDKLLPGEYYVANDYYMGKGTIYRPASFYPLVEVKYALEQGYITGEDITYAKIADRYIPADTFKTFASDMWHTMYNESKKIVNFYIGCLGSTKHTTIQSAITTDIDVAVATLADCSYGCIHKLPTESMKQEMFIIQNTMSFLKDRGNISIHRHIIASGVIALDKMVNALGLEASQIEAYNTDSIKFVGNFKDITKPTHTCAEHCKEFSHHFEDNEARPGDYRIESNPTEPTGKKMNELTKPKPFELVNEEITPLHEFEVEWSSIVKNGGVVVGGGGCGKTFRLAQIIKSLPEEVKNQTMVLCYNNAGCQTLRKEQVPAITMSSAMFSPNGELQTNCFKNTKHLFIDEFGLCPQTEMGMILSAQREYGFTVIALGDPNQTKAPVENWIDYTTSRHFMKMCGNTVVQMSYKQGCARYTPELYNVLTNFLETGTLNIQTSSIESYTNICYTNQTRQQLNKKCLTRWLKENNAEPVMFGFQVAKGMPVMCYYGKDAVKQVYKTQVWNITDIQKDTITLSREELDEKCEPVKRTATFSRTEFKSLFDYSFAFTVHKCQSMTIKGEFNIYEGYLMTRDVLYTGLSRGTALENIHLVSKRPGVYPLPIRQASILCSIKKQSVERGTIYCIKLTNGMSYVGQTTRTIAERFAEHQLKPITVMKGHLEGATIQELESFNFTEKKTLNEREKYWTNKMQDLLGDVANIKNKRKPVKAEKPVVEKRIPKISIYEDVSKKRFEVKSSRRNIAVEDQCKRFTWGGDKQKAFLSAQAWRDELINKYF
jgi:hypothetical protein